MLTDEQARTLFHVHAERELAEVHPPVGLLASVRREHDRRRRRSAILAPFGVAVVTIGAASAAVAWPHADRAQLVPIGPPRATHTAEPTGAQPTAAAEPGPTVRLFRYEFVLPQGFRITSRSGVIDLNTIQPPQPVGGRDASFTARQRSQSLDVIVYRGPIAAAEANVQPPSPNSVTHTTIAGYPATVDPYGTGTTCAHSRRDGVGAHNLPNGGPIGHCDSGTVSSEPVGLIETRVRTSTDELILIQSAGMSSAQVNAIVGRALRRG